MTECKHCEVISKKENLVYEDNEIVAFLSKEPASIGHIIILPREHRTILEQMTTSEISKMFVISNKLSAAEFGSLGLGGTNLIVNNGVAAGQEVPHVAMHLIPRMQQGDNLKLEWQPKQLSEEEKSIAEIKLKEGASKIMIGTAHKREVVVKDDQTPIVPEERSGENYLEKDFERIP
jgi:histidine triad (HIT) family protein